MRRLVIVLCAALLGQAFARAGVYQSVSLVPCDVDSNGMAVVPPLDTFLTTVNILKKTDKPENEEAQELRKRISELVAAVAKNRNPEDVLELAADYLRFRNANNNEYVAKAINVLQPLSSRPPEELGFRALSLQAHALFLNSMYPDAVSRELSALTDYPFPDRLAGLSAAQRGWYHRLEKDYNLLFMRLRARDALLKTPINKEQVDAIFPTGKGTTPVHFVGESGQFEPGTIAAAEQAKLPPDAIAIVEQLILWHVDDGRLWWLLAELYNAQGDLKNSARVFKLCFQEAKYTNPEPRNHYDLVVAALVQLEAKEAVARARAEEDAKKAKQQKYQLAIVGVVAAVLLAGYWQAREIVRRNQNRRKKNAKQLGPMDQP